MAVQIHSSTKLTPPHHDEPVPIDNAMVDLMRAIWAQGWQTAACCQDAGEAVEGERNHGHPSDEPTGNAGFIEYYRGWAWLKMPQPDALAFLGKLAGDERLHDLVTTRWAKGSWRLHTQIIWTGDAFTSAPFSQIYLPKQQITVVVKALNDRA